MGRKNKRKSTEYRDRLGFNPKKYISQAAFYPSRRALPSHIMYPAGRTPHRGDIWFAELGAHPGTSVQGGCRPVMIVSNNIGNERAETINVLPMTRHLKRSDLPCHTELSPESVADKRQNLDPSMILAEQITTVSKSQLRAYVGRIENPDILESINHSVSVQLELTENKASAEALADEHSENKGEEKEHV